MFKIITTKKYRELKFQSEIAEIFGDLLDICKERIDIKNKEIESLKKDNEELKTTLFERQKQLEEHKTILKDDLISFMEERYGVIKRDINVYRLDWAKDKKKVKGVAFKGTKKELDKLINKNIKKYAKKTK